MWTFIKKLIPARIIIRSWYWIDVQKKMEKELKDIFLTIDMGGYEWAKTFIAEFRKKYDAVGMPLWLSLETHAQISRAEAMLACLSEPLIEEDANK